MATTRALESLRTLLVTADPGLARLRLATVAVASMALAAGLVSLGRATVLTGEPVTIVLFAGVLAMISNLAVNETSLPRQRVTTVLMTVPALVATVAGTLLSPYRVVADVVFVLVMVGAVYVRRFGPRGFALGQGAFMAFFFTQFLKAQPAQVPALCVAVLLGIGSTLLLRGVLFAERPERTLRRLVDAFRARAHEMVLRVDDVLEAAQESVPEHPVAGRSPGAEHEQVGEVVLERLYRARRRLNETALLVEDQLERTTAERVWPGLENDVLALRVVDTELGLERLGVAVRRMVRTGEPGSGEADQRPTPLALTALRTGLVHLGRALERRVPHRRVLGELADARGAVAGLVADIRPGHERVQRAAFAVRRVSDSVEYAQRDAPARPGDATTEGIALPGVPRSASPVEVAGEAAGDGIADGRPDPPGTAGGAEEEKRDAGLLLTTRQAVQVGVGTTLAIVIGELLAPQRWYWAVIAAFVVFANTNSRGDLLSRGWGRVVGTVGGVAAGMALAALTAGNQTVSLILLFVCAFLALYLVRVSPGMLAFWITAVLALVYGLIGQFSVETLLLRIEETLAGVVASVLAAFLVLPKGTREAFGESVEAFVDTADDVLTGAVGTILGQSSTPPLERARDMDTALATLRARVRPLLVDTPKRRGRSSHRRALRVFVVVDHYARALARLAADLGTTPDPGWSPTLSPALQAVRDNLDGLRDVVVRGKRRSDGGQVLVGSAEELVDRAEAYAARGQDPHRRQDALVVTRLLRRIDQAVVALAVDLGAARDEEAEEVRQSPSTRASAGLVNTRSGS
ncbi:FUSC family protein [Actinomycetospora endophytica]|uniref:FUSC family protein n=1 Tax=Actinomycetospora endophytica TaxID=2291215 RepID=UPI001E585D66|nr:FUSC family protein [Actinomycetospora endophytica]